jgi:iron-sulfur cluster assembly protein
MIELSPSAAREIQRWQKSHQSGSYLRLRVKNGGCSGLYYTLELSDTRVESDRDHESQGMRIVIDEQSQPYLRELKVDYAEDLMGGGFRFINPNAKNSCGCGLSFSGE